MSDEATVPGVDASVPSVARVYDFLLGGKDNFASDRTMAKKLMEVSPEIRDTALMNREFGKRVTECVAAEGIGQYVDMGSGIPTTPPSIHDTARAEVPGARVVYVDNDSVVAAHSRALRTTAPGLGTIEADVRHPDRVFTDPELTGNIDLTRPVAVLFISVLQTVREHDDVLAIVRDVRGRMAVGSYLAISHVWDGSTPEAIANIHRSSNDTGYPPVAIRSTEQVAEYFDGFEILTPGLVDIRDWRPDGEPPDVTIRLVGGVGRKL
ncbi:MAG TPA: SAM-dependent methyltransferase [Stackebrandtia sp.]|jgi:hypothetical protein|uniref:SAM-dependent methyltransferase n=1 Tax=Stackebrandtia sp. TaxID=2023065 RepID=UPI002D245F7B|nr:SAM-dependent methyltransferase [Stackebrandtia sp.]HZE38667.1 SAM-dependent methyltransferase [Stackebrandtia sp.]